MTDFKYYVVENSFAARVSEKTRKAERLLADGTWHPYPDVWDVCTNGRWIASERDALDEAAEIFELRGVPHHLARDPRSIHEAESEPT